MTTTTTVFAAIGAFVLGAAVALGAEHFVFKARDQRDAMSTIGGFQGWRLSCPPRTDKSGICMMSEALARRQGGQVFAELSIAPDKDKTDQLTVVAPLGIFLLPGAKVAVGNTVKTVSYKTCLPGGCIATLPIDKGLADAMSKGSSIQVTVITADGKSVPLNFSLSGFGDAMAARAVDMAARK
ncbi:MAG TPA: invasion associated locus B family protein [Rhizomicrobium sp.]|nr:invasion associated locus B family protein [Rhizomicrobium sp.]